MSVGVARLKRRSDFLRVAAARLKVVTPGMIVQAAGTDSGGIGLGLTASRKVGNAVARNRARRRLKALASGMLTRYGWPSTDYVLIARRETVSRPFADLARDLETALLRLKKKAPRT